MTKQDLEEIKEKDKIYPIIPLIHCESVFKNTTKPPALSYRKFLKEKLLDFSPAFLEHKRLEIRDNKILIEEKLLDGSYVVEKVFDINKKNYKKAYEECLCWFNSFR